MVIILVNHFSKCLFLIPYYKNINAKKAAQLYIYYVYQIYRLLNTIISDRGLQFILAFYGILPLNRQLDRDYKLIFRLKTLALY